MTPPADNAWDIFWPEATIILGGTSVIVWDLSMRSVAVPCSIFCTFWMHCGLARNKPAHKYSTNLVLMNDFKLDAAAHRERHEGFLDVEAVLGFIVYDGVRAIDHTGGDFVTAIDRHAVHVDRGGF